ncbi:MAG: lipoate--protein ligase family protein [bacterium]
MTPWQCIVSEPATGKQNMAVDLESFRNFKVPTIRIYSWSNKCLSVGYAQKVDELIDVSKAKREGWEIVKRPTGGGIVFHNQAEVTFSVVAGLDDLPEGLIPSYYKISEAVVLGLRNIGMEVEINEKKVESGARNTGMCFAYPAEYELVCQGKKIVGSAQKRNKKALLQQGSIFVRNPGPEVLKLLKNPGEDLNAISVEEVLGRGVSFDEMAQALMSGFARVLYVDFGT